MSSTTTTSFTPARLAPRPSSPLVPSPLQRKKMSINQTYYLAHKARAKLSSEASRPDHNLRLLVGHANLLDSLMVELADAEREQESYFNQSVRAPAAKVHQEEKPELEWDEEDTIIEDPQEDWEVDDATTDSDSDSDSDDSLSTSSSASNTDDDIEYDEEGDIEMADVISLRRVASHSSSYVRYNNPNKLPLAETMDYEMLDEEAVEFEDDEEDLEELSLTRSPSHSLHSHSHSPPPPELADDDEDSSEDEPMPPSPPNDPLPDFTKQVAGAPIFGQTTSSNPDTIIFYDQGYYLPRRTPQRLVSAISVY